MPGEYLDLSSDPADGASSSPRQTPSSSRPEGARPEPPSGRRFLGILFKCCRIYSKIFPNRDGTAYVGNCPRCARAVRVEIGAGGSDTRFFTAY